ncbi:hypothetical protein FJT64_021791 [Amphibalanus amphitrite]|uniref:Uncharacterized protein n=1 Tax=Amphibalanus amphitrite TaxID=1232801 RepID=A0A6A4WNC4_AMPAM|nr:hypothetical protein FJT64_021791 [Amphibalanus amphitrite]
MRLQYKPKNRPPADPSGRKLLHLNMHSPGPSDPGAQPTSASIDGRLSRLVVRLAGLATSVAQLEETGRELERSAENTSSDQNLSRLASHVISLQNRQKQKLQELSHSVTERLTVLKAHLRDLTMEVQQLRGLATAQDGPQEQRGPIERIVSFFRAFERQSDPELRQVPMAILQKANYTIIDMVSFHANSADLDKLLSIKIIEPKL